MDRFLIRQSIPQSKNPFRARMFYFKIQLLTELLPVNRFLELRPVRSPAEQHTVSSGRINSMGSQTSAIWSGIACVDDNMGFSYLEALLGIMPLRGVLLLEPTYLVIVQKAKGAISHRAFRSLGLRVERL